LKRGSMRFWLCASALAFACLLVSAREQKQRAHSATEKINESTLGGLRPGRDTVKRARKLHRYFEQVAQDGNSFVEHSKCFGYDFYIESDATGTIKTIRLADDGSDGMIECFWRNDKGPPRLTTGRGLTIYESTLRVVQLYGEPTSRSPSTKNGQPLELLYYAFDWAGPDVPQVMEVVCTAPKDGTPGRVVEITLAASSL